MKQWDGSKISDFWQLSRAFLWLPVFSRPNNNTTEVPGKVLLGTSNGGAYSASQTPDWRGGDWLPLPKNPAPVFSIVNFGYASVNYSIWSLLADVERTLWGCGSCGWSTDQTNGLFTPPTPTRQNCLVSGVNKP